MVAYIHGTNKDDDDGINLCQLSVPGMVEPISWSTEFLEW